MKRGFTLVLLWLCLPVAAWAQKIQLNPNQPVTLRFDNVRLIQPGTPATNVSGLAAQAEFLLDTASTTLTIRLQNLSTASANAVLYGLDLGLPQRLLNRNKLEASFREFPVGGTWLGPTDNAAPTAGLGFSVFAARAAVLQRFEDFLATETALPAGFLPFNQGGTITLRISYSPSGREPVFNIEPRLYFLAPAPSEPLKRRVPLVVGLTPSAK